jgi:hypothetical protein
VLCTRLLSLSLLLSFLSLIFLAQNTFISHLFYKYLFFLVWEWRKESLDGRVDGMDGWILEIPQIEGAFTRRYFLFIFGI